MPTTFLNYQIDLPYDASTSGTGLNLADGNYVDAGDRPATTVSYPGGLSHNFMCPKNADGSQNIVSFDFMNGWITEGNFATSPAWTISASDVEKGANGGGKSVQSTKSLDYFCGRVFPDVTPKTTSKYGNTDPDTDRLYYLTNQYKEIPGAGINLFIPYDVTAVVITWSLCWAGNGRSTDLSYPEDWYVDSGLATDNGYDFQHQWAAVGLQTNLGEAYRKYDDLQSQMTGQLHTVRYLPITRFQDTYTNYHRLLSRGHGKWGVVGNREFSGHHTVNDVKKGIYRATLVLTGCVPQIRVRARAMRYIYFR